MIDHAGKDATKQKLLAILRRRLTYANVAATLALFIALGGTSFAALKLGRHSIKSKNIAPGAVRARNLARNAVTSPKIKDGVVGTADLSAEALAELRGAQGPAGERGPTGERGPSGISEYALVAQDGTLVRGTATSAQRLAQGNYRLRFGRNVSGCAAGANTAFFAGATSAANRISVKLSIGFDGGAPEASTITVDTYDSTGVGGSEDTSFSLVMVC